MNLGLGIGVGFYPSATSKGWTPYILPNLAAWYDLSDSSSYITATGVKLLGDKSGNSNVNVLALNGVAGNYASTPDSVPLSITGDIDIRVNVALTSWTPGAIWGLLAKYAGAGNRSYQFYITAAGNLNLTTSVDGTAQTGGDSTAIVPGTNFSPLWVRAARVAATGVCTYYTSPDGTTWTQLGNTIGTSIGGIFDGTASLFIGSITGAANFATGNFYRAQVYASVNGTNLAFDANFALPAKNPVNKTTYIIVQAAHFWRR